LDRRAAAADRQVFEPQAVVTFDDAEDCLAGATGGLLPAGDEVGDLRRRQIGFHVKTVFAVVRAALCLNLNRAGKPWREVHSDTRWHRVVKRRGDAELEIALVLRTGDVEGRRRAGDAAIAFRVNGCRGHGHLGIDALDTL